MQHHEKPRKSPSKHKQAHLAPAWETAGTPVPFKRMKKETKLIRQKLVRWIKDLRWIYGLCYLHVIVSERTAEFIVVHTGLVLADSPEPGHLLCLQQFELPVAGGPTDDILVLRLLQELEEELPQGDSTVHSSKLQFRKADKRQQIRNSAFSSSPYKGVMEQRWYFQSQQE